MFYSLLGRTVWFGLKLFLRSKYGSTYVPEVAARRRHGGGRAWASASRCCALAPTSLSLTVAPHPTRLPAMAGADGRVILTRPARRRRMAARPRRRRVLRIHPAAADPPALVLRLAGGGERRLEPRRARPPST